MAEKFSRGLWVHRESELLTRFYHAGRNLDAMAGFTHAELPAWAVKLHLF